MKTAKMLRKEFNDLTGKGTEVPGFIGEPIVFTQSYVRWLEKRLINASDRTAQLKELVKAYEHLLDCFGIKKPEKSTHIDSLDAAFKRITELNNNLK